MTDMKMITECIELGKMTMPAVFMTTSISAHAGKECRAVTLLEELWEEFHSIPEMANSLYSE